jgi:DNA polymerase V
LLMSDEINDREYPFCVVIEDHEIERKFTIGFEGGDRRINMKNRTYIAIDLKSFYASVECMERGFDPLTTNLVVADISRTEKTICLAVSPSLKAYGISGRARLFEVVQKVKEVNAVRLRNAPGQVFSGASFNDIELKSSPSISLDYIAAPPRMAYYIEYSTRIYNIYLKYIAPEDIHVYSIDEVLIDATDYLNTYNLSARELATKMIQDVHKTTGVTATAGIGTNLYLSKIAMDIQAKRIPVDQNGVQIAELDEMSYRHLMWSHRPLTDFWRVGKGYAKKLEEQGLFTMGDIARCSIGKPTDYYNEDLLYKLFGINAELLIDHAWGWEPCTIADIKAYKPSTNSIGSGQVLQYPYPFDKAKLIVREMTDLLALDLVDKRLVTDQLVLTVGYDIENLTDPKIKKAYHGAITFDNYGRSVPKSAHGTTNLGRQTSSAKLIMDAVTELFERIVDKDLLIRRVNIAANHVVDEATVQKIDSFEQLDLFTDYLAVKAKKENEEAGLSREKKVQKAMLEIKKKYGKNAILKGINLEEGATTLDRNKQIGGHKA